MSRKLYMAVDLGTSFLKAGVYSLDGQCWASWNEPVRDERPAPGVFIQRGDMLYDAVIACIRNAAGQLEDPSQVCAIAFTGQMAGCIGVDEDWNDVTGWSCTLDSRYLPYADSQREKFAGDIFAISATSAPVMCSKYAWFRDKFPNEHARIAKYVMLNGYMIGRLSGIPITEAKIDETLITWTGIADVKNRSWSQKLCDEMGIDMNLLPEIVGCADVGGYLSRKSAELLNLRPGIPLIMGAGDKVSGCTGAGILDLGDMIFEASSYGAVSCMVEDVRLDTKGRSYDVIGAAMPGSYYLHKYIQGSGMTIQWFMDNFVKEAGEDSAAAFRRAEEMASRVPMGSEHMLCVGLLSGSAIPFDSEIRGMFMGHTLSHGKGYFYRALLESFSYDLALTMNSIRENYPQYRDHSVKLIGGGAKSLVWPQMLADVCGCAFETLDRADVALWGTALIAAAGVSDAADVKKTARENVSVRQVYLPDEKANAFYQPYVKLYGQVTKDLHRTFEKLNAL